MNDDIFKKFGLHHNALEEAAKTLGTHKSIFDEQARLTQQLHPSASLIEEALSREYPKAWGNYAAIF